MENGLNGTAVKVLTQLNVKIGALIGFFHAYTFLVWGLMVAECLTGGVVVLPIWFRDVYISFLGAYTSQKETTRWFIGKNYVRWGQIWVYVWMATGLLFGYLNGIYPSIFMTGDKFDTI